MQARQDVDLLHSQPLAPKPTTAVPDVGSRPHSRGKAKKADHLILRNALHVPDPTSLNLDTLEKRLAIPKDGSALRTPQFSIGEESQLRPIPVWRYNNRADSSNKSPAIGILLLSQAV